jgi:hypothetical protein
VSAPKAGGENVLNGRHNAATNRHSANLKKFLIRA